MSQNQTASPDETRRRRGGRSKPMAVDTRYARMRRREQAVAARAKWLKKWLNWQDWLIPGGVIACLGTISAYHHAALSDAMQGAVNALL
ncbi:MAG: hypothetical protein ACREVL_02985 [Solimonas sp.]